MNIATHFKNKKVLITGHTGFKGSWLTLWMLKMEADVYGVSDKIPTQPSMFEELALEKKIHHHFCDIRNYPEFEKIVLETKPDYIFHLAAQPIVSLSYSDPLTTLTTNIIGTSNMLESIRKLENDCVVVCITSDKCYENVEQVWGYKENDQLGGKDIYSCSKGAAELVIHAFYHSFFKDKKPNIRIASARAGNVIGGGDFSKDRIVPDCMRAWNLSQKVVIRNPHSTRPWQHVLEPLSGYIRLAAQLSIESGLNGESFNFGPKAEQDKSVLQLIASLSKYWNFENPDQAYEYVKMDAFKEAGLLKLNCDKALFYLDWQANLDFHHTISFVSKWYAHFYNGSEDMEAFTMAQISEYEKLEMQRK